MQEWLSPSSHIWVNTSGSTGVPKTIRINKNKMITSATRTGSFLNLKSHDKALLCLPVDFIAGKMIVVRSFALGLDLYMARPTSDPLKEINENFAFAAMTPMQIHHTLMGRDGIEKLNNIHTLIIGGGEMDSALIKKVGELSNDTFQTYGMTETITHIALKKLSGPSSESTYLTLPGIVLEQDKRGCLVINDKKLGLKKLRTNDLVELISESEFKYLGRFDHVINTGGVKVVPEVVEKKLNAHMKNRIVIAGKKDKVLGEKVILIIETKESMKPDDVESVIHNTALHKYEIPREIFYVDYFPESKNGKILRKQLLSFLYICKS